MGGRESAGAAWGWAGCVNTGAGSWSSLTGRLPVCMPSQVGLATLLEGAAQLTQPAAQTRPSPTTRCPKAVHGWGNTGGGTCTGAAAQSSFLDEAGGACTKTAVVCTLGLSCTGFDILTFETLARTHAHPCTPSLSARHPPALIRLLCKLGGG